MRRGPNVFPEPLPEGHEPDLDPPPGHDDSLGAKQEATYGAFKIPAYLTFSREMLLDSGAIEPTPEEAAERAERARVRLVERREAWVVYEAALLALAQLDDPLARKVLDLHRPSRLEGPTCDGCDFDGWEAEEPRWPCRTVQAVAEVHGIALPAADDLWTRP